MKKILTLAICAGILSPFYASAQTITLGVEGATSIDSLITAMSADVNELFTDDLGSGNLSQDADIYWDSGLGWGVSDNDAPGTEGSYAWHFEERSNPADLQPIIGEFEVGYIGNESEDDNQFLIQAFYGPTQTVTVWDYDSNDPNSVDDPPQSYRVYRDNDIDSLITFAHLNESQDGTLWATHSNDDRFKFWEMSDDDITYWLIGISDRNDTFDGDIDDGFFLVKFSEGGLPPVPEPSQIAAMALLGMGALLFIRRRFARK